MSGVNVITDKVKNFIFKKSNENKVIICAFVFNVVIYWFYFLFFGLNLDGGTFINDYYLNFSPAVHYFLTDPSSIYSAFYLRPFRNLPAAVFYYMLFYWLPHANHIDFYVCSLWVIIWNFGSCILLIEILKLQKFKENKGTSIFSSAMVVVALYLLNFWQQTEYFEVNTNVMTGFFVLLGMYYFLSDREHLGYVAWSIAVIFKVTILFLILFFIFQPPFKRFLKNGIFALIPQIPNFIIFAFWPNLIPNLINVNITTAENMSNYFFFSGSIARQISWYFSLPLITLAIPIFIAFFAVNLFLCYKSRQLVFINRLMLAFLTTIVAFPDFEGNHVLFFQGVYLLWLASKKDLVFSRSTKIIVGFPVLTYILFYFRYDIPFPNYSLFFLIPLLIIDYRLLVSLKKAIGCSNDK